METVLVHGFPVIVPQNILHNIVNYCPLTGLVDDLENKNEDEVTGELVVDDYFWSFQFVYPFGYRFSKERIHYVLGDKIKHGMDWQVSTCQSCLKHRCIICDIAGKHRRCSQRRKQR